MRHAICCIHYPTPSCLKIRARRLITYRLMNVPIVSYNRFSGRRLLVFQIHSVPQLFLQIIKWCKHPISNTAQKQQIPIRNSLHVYQMCACACTLFCSFFIHCIMNILYVVYLSVGCYWLTWYFYQQQSILTALLIALLCE